MVVTLVAQGIPLLQRGLWFLLPAVTLALLMVHAMMECVAAFIATSPNKSASSRAALLSRLMALGKAGQPYRLEPSAVGDLDVRFDPVDPLGARDLRACASRRNTARDSCSMKSVIKSDGSR